MSDRAYAAVDLGAESGRVIVGVLEGVVGSERVRLHEVHRFQHTPLEITGVMRWNLVLIWREIARGLRAAGEWARSAGVILRSVGVDTWGVDFALLGRKGELIDLPRCYRDTGHERGVAVLAGAIGFERLYAITGIQEAALNTACQLAALGKAEPGLLGAADRLLLMPDLFHYLLTGTAVNEASIASTSQLINATTGDWSGDVLEKLGVPPALFRPTVAPGAVIGALRAFATEETGLPPDTLVVAPASHDTASAVAATPGAGESWCYLSSGTWSVMGAELSAPILSEEARQAGFTNERGVGGAIRFSRNLIGLWLVQEVRRDLERQGTVLDYAQLADAAAACEPFRTRIDAAHGAFLAPGEMIGKLQAFARGSGDREPESPGELVRCCLEGLAMAYRECVLQLEKLLERRIDSIHVVGGGSRNALLCQMAANATGRRVLAGPVEATAAGNVLVQAMTDGRVQEVVGLRDIVARSFDLIEYRPRDTAAWEAAASRHEEVCAIR